MYSTKCMRIGQNQFACMLYILFRCTIYIYMENVNKNLLVLPRYEQKDDRARAHTQDNCANFELYISTHQIHILLIFRFTRLPAYTFEYNKVLYAINVLNMHMSAACLTNCSNMALCQRPPPPPPHTHINFSWNLKI